MNTDHRYTLEQKALKNELLEKQIQWVFRSDQHNGFVSFPPKLNMMIEKHYRSKVISCEFTEQDTYFCFDFIGETMERPLPKRPIQRKVPSILLPPHWEPMDESVKSKRVLLDMECEEYNKVAQSFLDGLGHVVVLNKIERIQNPSLRLKYDVHKRSMQCASETPGDTERVLWHGTTHDAVQHICANGVNRSYHGVNATKFGKGAYFARDASLSMRYSVPDADGVRCMFQCRVLTGDYTRGHHGLVDVPLKNWSGSSLTRYDSVVDNIYNPSIFVIFSDTQAYPAYLITFEKLWVDK